MFILQCYHWLLSNKIRMYLPYRQRKNRRRKFDSFHIRRNLRYMGYGTCPKKFFIVAWMLRSASVPNSYLKSRYIRYIVSKQQKNHRIWWFFCCGDPYGNRTHVFAVRGRCLSRLTNGPNHTDCAVWLLLYHSFTYFARAFWDFYEILRKYSSRHMPEW